jgi:hypothetical protein
MGSGGCNGSLVMSCVLFIRLNIESGCVWETFTHFDVASLLLSWLGMIISRVASGSALSYHISLEKHKASFSKHEIACYIYTMTFNP